MADPEDAVPDAKQALLRLMVTRAGRPAAKAMDVQGFSVGCIGEPTEAALGPMVRSGNVTHRGPVRVRVEDILIDWRRS